MTGEGPKLRTLDDLTAAMQEAVGGKCDRCRREAATFHMKATLTTPRVGTGQNKPSAVIKGAVCEPCAVEILSVVGRALGKVGAA